MDISDFEISCENPLTTFVVYYGNNKPAFSCQIRESEDGKKVYMLTDDIPVGIVSIKDSLIENLYVLPERFGKGYGSKLLSFAIEKCTSDPTLTVLNNNSAIEMYRKFGFKETGVLIPLNENLWEIEMKLEKEHENNGSRLW